VLEAFDHGGAGCAIGSFLLGAVIYVAAPPGAGTDGGEVQPRIGAVWAVDQRDPRAGSRRILAMLPDTMFPEALERGGALIALATAVGFSCTLLLAQAAHSTGGRHEHRR
jgi:hypothetical protein